MLKEIALMQITVISMNLQAFIANSLNIRLVHYFLELTQANYNLLTYTHVLPRLI